MISYSRDPKQEIPSSSVKIVGLGGAGSNMLERIALDNIEGAELLALNTDIRTLAGSLAKEKIQLGVNLTKGLGTGGDPELGQQAMLEAEESVRTALKGQQIVFLCAGLGGGTGSGAAPIVARIAREEGAFVVVFATMPFFFEGRRRRDQADTALNELAVLSNALVTFDNNRMGELVLAKQGIHEAFTSADKMISESIKAVIRLVIRPGIINVGLDDLMSALRTTRSRCLFGSGIASGKDRASKALRNALSSPLLDQGSLLKEAQTVLVHLSGGESLTLFEIELLMQNLQKHVPEKAHVLFGAAIDPSMEDNLSITLISALPEDVLTGGTRDSIAAPAANVAALTSLQVEPEETVNPFTAIDESEPEAKLELPEESKTIVNPFTKVDPPQPEVKLEIPEEPKEIASPFTTVDPSEPEAELEHPKEVVSPFTKIEKTEPEAELELHEEDLQIETKAVQPPTKEKEERPFAETDFAKPLKFESQELINELEEEAETIEEVKEVAEPEAAPESKETEEKEDETLPSGSESEKPPSKLSAPIFEQKNKPTGKPLWVKKNNPNASLSKVEDPFKDGLTEETEFESSKKTTKLKLDEKVSGNQSELSFDKSPKGRFEGENPNVFEGEDLDLPPFLRKKKP